MASLIGAAFSRLLAIKPGETLLLLSDALGESLDLVREAAAAIPADSLPGSSEGAIDRWLDALGIAFDPSLTLQEKQAAALAAHTVLGGQSLDYIQAQIRIAFPNITIIEGTPSSFSFELRGNYPNINDLPRFRGLVQKLAPLHLTYVDNARAVEGMEVARAGLGVAGVARTGKGTT